MEEPVIKTQKNKIKEIAQIEFFIITSCESTECKAVAASEGPPVFRKLSGWNQSGEQSHAGRSQPLLAIYSRWREAGGASEEGAALSISATSSARDQTGAAGRLWEEYTLYLNATGL